jgi:hypothetical protein
MESVVNKKQQDVRKAGIDAQQIESDITRLSSQIKVIRDIKSLTSDQAIKKAKELQAEVDNLRSKYSEYAKSLKEVQKNASSVTRVNNVLKLQQDALARKRAEKINQLQGQYARLPEKEAKKKIKAYMKAWEKNAQDELKIRNEKAGRVIDPGHVSGVTDTKSKMDETLKRIDELDSMLAPLKRFAGLTMEERSYESQKIEGLMSKKKEELRNATKKIARRQAVLDAELNSDLWEARIEKKLGEDARFAVHATKHMPLSYALIALHSGAEKRTKEMMRYAWEHFSPGRQTKLGHTLKQQLKIAPVHFGSKGFIVDPRYPKLNSQLVMMLDFGIKAVASVQDEAATTNMLLKAAMDAYRKTSEALAEHKEAYEQFFDEVAVWLKSKKAVFVLEEIVEELVADNKIETTGKKMNKKQLTEFTQNMVDLIRNAHALRKLASFVWPNYREEMHTWLRNSFRVVTTKKG